AAIVIALGISMLLTRWLLPRIDASPTSWRMGRGGLSRIAFPVLALLALLAARALFFTAKPTHLLDVAVPLLGSMALIRLAIYVLRHVFPPNPLIKASERVIGWGIWSLLALHIVGALPFLTTFLDGVAVTVGKQHISLWLIIQALVTVIVTVVIALWIARMIESRLISAPNLDTSLLAVVSKLVRAVLLALAVLISLPAVGIDITVLSVFGGALGVGLGFGLQKIASNYVSGFIILLDRSIRLGDLVTVDNRHGVVSQLNTRYTVVRSLDGTEAIIPNEALITGTVINHSFSDKRVLLKLSIQISSKSSLETALEILTRIAREHPRVIADPAPGAYIKGFGDSGVDLELCVWITDPEAGQMPLRSELYLRIWQAFKAEGVEIPYPQREIRIVNDPGEHQDPS
ncbi:MAG: mechanosensitive ion channel domain-containing protein, partial [Burkholderiales bacterium]